VQRAVVIVRLKEGAQAEAERLLSSGPPFDPAEAGFERHAVYAVHGELVFVFEGPDAEWRLDDLASDFFHPVLQDAIEIWRPLLDGEPRVGREVYSWERGRAGDA
jgi:hypothetical protein